MYLASSILKKLVVREISLMVRLKSLFIFSLDIGEVLILNFHIAFLRMFHLNDLSTTFEASSLLSVNTVALSSARQGVSL
jgi:hypothetical protein